MPITPGWCFCSAVCLTALGKRVKDWEGVRKANSHEDYISLQLLSNSLWMRNNAHVGDVAGNFSGYLGAPRIVEEGMTVVQVSCIQVAMFLQHIGHDRVVAFFSFPSYRFNAQLDMAMSS